MSEQVLSPQFHYARKVGILCLALYFLLKFLAFRNGIRGTKELDGYRPVFKPSGLGSLLTDPDKYIRLPPTAFSEIERNAYHGFDAEVTFSYSGEIKDPEPAPWWWRLLGRTRGHPALTIKGLRVVVSKRAHGVAARECGVSENTRSEILETMRLPQGRPEHGYWKVTLRPHGVRKVLYLLNRTPDRNASITAWVVLLTGLFSILTTLLFDVK